MKKLMTFLVAAFLALAVAAPEPVEAQSSRTVYSARAWRVELVTWANGSRSCEAKVTYPGESFSIWADNNNPVRLQFYSTSWSFGKGDTANLQVQIDRRPIWTLTNAELYLNSILFNLPRGNTGTRFLREVMAGNVLYLRTERGGFVQNYTLSGSNASIQALINCVDRL